MKTRLKQAGVGLTVAGALAIGIVGAWEGMRTKAYRDIVGVPTLCFGETRGVKMGDTATPDECRAMLGDALVEFEQGMRKCLTRPDAIPDKSYVAFLSLTYNIGVGAFCKASIPKKINAGDVRAACNTLPAFNRAGGRVVKGLVNRRAEERKICLQGVN